MRPVGARAPSPTPVSRLSPDVAASPKCGLRPRVARRYLVSEHNQFRCPSFMRHPLRRRAV